MFKHLYALRFDRQLSVGRNKACIIECADMSNQRTEAIVKFSGSESGPYGLIREALAAFLARDLDISIPEPLLVEIPNGFSAGPSPSNAQANALMARSSKFAFGSTALPAGFTIYAPAMQLRGPVVERAAHIFVFDTLISNSDRAPSNPNCMVRGENAVVIDHDLAFMLDALFWKQPWKLGGGETIAAPDKHIFWTLAKAHNFDFEEMKGRLMAISDERLGEYLDALPSDWKVGNDSAERIVDYIKSLRDNAAATFSEIQRVLQ